MNIKPRPYENRWAYFYARIVCRPQGRAASDNGGCLPRELWPFGWLITMFSDEEVHPPFLCPYRPGGFPETLNIV